MYSHTHTRNGAQITWQVAEQIAVDEFMPMELAQGSVSAMVSQL